MSIFAAFSERLCVYRKLILYDLITIPTVLYIKKLKLIQECVRN